MSAFILASASPRRLELLKRVGFDPRVMPADIDETPWEGELPADYVLRMAKEKATKVASSHKDKAVLAADTIVTLGNEILGKAHDVLTANEMLSKLSGATHRVSTAIALHYNATLDAQITSTDVEMSQWSDDALNSYVSTGEWRGKAGSYAIQGIAAAMVAKIHGSVTSVIGLPLAETLALLRKAGIEPQLSKGVAV